MMMKWGPWIEHDGKGCPCRGHYVRGVHADGTQKEWIAGTNVWSGHTTLDAKPTGRPEVCRWSWAIPGNRTDPRYHIIRYRIRKPRGLTILEELIADLPAPVGPKIDA